MARGEKAIVSYSYDFGVKNGTLILNGTIFEFFCWHSNHLTCSGLETHYTSPETAARMSGSGQRLAANQQHSQDLLMAS